MSKRTPPNQVEVALAEDAKAGDPDAIERLMALVEKDVLGLVFTIKDPHIRDDAAQAIRVMLLDAIKKFDVHQAKWVTYVRRRLRFMLTDYFRSSYPAGFRSRANPLRKTMDLPCSLDSLVDEHGFEEYEAECELSSIGFQDVDTHDFLECIESRDELRECALWARGFTMREIAEQTGIHESRVSQRITAAKRHGLGEYVTVAAGLDY